MSKNNEYPKNQPKSLVKLPRFGYQPKKTTKPPLPPTVKPESPKK